MTCERVITGQVTEHYVLGQLDEAETQAFEQHYFDCERCYEELRLYRSLRNELSKEPGPVVADKVVGRSRWLWVWAPAAAVVILGVAVSVWLGQRPGPGARRTQVISELAEIEPPPHTVSTLRQPPDAAGRHFREAMEHYTRGDFSAAIPGLSEAHDLNPDAPNATFFLGICFLLTDETDAAIDFLRRTIALGESPYMEEAHYYLAKSFLRTGNLEAAAVELQNTIKLGGELETETKELLERIGTLEETSP